ncbi:N-acetylmuramic acid 6-phosphate etherase [Bacillus canaveralius]|uniref:N-acetylmuramic acid 6-phosphate etherase n=1 Tax=Bacillus canaveralius TaxID=1403243 RepID=A0A2N5GQJ1_9BACI|nr:N-acetylmuramic acid 6-phosphate etherase [Bacillus canaveralius]PLR85346.1 N-acetylmuramic acid 6-phosphate etherase [Bacillus canaveralius]PLR99334.1 N-acetylmuramic acid 6-phosphate etherase [Bacillus canaveralius]RSK48586.1 N-acetylmuramic acid 6-phosphate etherase [Bacillus canaveralius]
MNISKLNTEQRNPKTMNIDLMATDEIISTINEEDSLVPIAIARELPSISKTVDMIVASFKSGGRLIYTGAGTSGRIGIIDASECPPTYGTEPEMVVGIIAGGKKAMTEAVEGAEDDHDQGRKDLEDIHLSAQDIVVGIAASGRTPYTIGALEYANQIGAATVAVVCSKDSEMEKVAKVTIAPIVGPEVVTGSTRMKAGTAQKLVLNMLTTASMIKMGKVYGNLMVDVQMTNEKLFKRAENIVKMATGADEETVKAALDEQNYNTKAAIVQILTGLEAKAAADLLEKHSGYLRKAIGE